MQTRRLGNLEFSAIGMGCMGLSFGLGPAQDKSEAIRVLEVRGKRLAETLLQYSYR